MDRQDFLAVLDLLLGEGDIDESFLTNPTDSPESHALLMSYERFKEKIGKAYNGTL
jgi:hypothetical protein